MTDIVEEPDQKWTESAIEDLLVERFSPPEYVCVSQVRDATGTAQQRTADAIAIGCWASKGLEIHGFEVKARRGAWLDELKKPEKADRIARMCDRWFVVAPPDVVKKDEVPAGWGFIAVRGAGKLITVKPAPLIEHADIKTMSRALAVSMIRNILEKKRKPEEAIRQKAFAEGRDAGLREAKEQGLFDEKQAERRLEDLQRVVKAFETTSGIQIRCWDAGRVGDDIAAVAKLLPHRGKYANVVDNTISQLESAKQAMVAARDALTKSDFNLDTAAAAKVGSGE